MTTSGSATRIVEVVTDKVNAEVPSPFEGTLTSILVAEGETIANDVAIAEIETAGAAAAGAPAAARPLPWRRAQVAPIVEAAPTAPAPPPAPEVAAAPAPPCPPRVARRGRHRPAAPPPPPLPPRSMSRPASA